MTMGSEINVTDSFFYPSFNNAAFLSLISQTDKEMPAGQYFEHNRYVPDSPDTFFAKDLPPPISDSTQTPPSPSPGSKLRRSISRPSQAQAQSNQHTPNSQSLKRSSTSQSHGPSQQVRRERERQLANTPREALIHLAIKKEHEVQEAKHLLSTAILQMESLRDRLAREEESRKLLEEENRSLGMKTTKAILDAQKESMSAKEDIGICKLQLLNMERELKHANDVARSAQRERDDADKALVRARTAARSLKEQTILLQAREEGRRQGFEEGLRQGRIIQESMPMDGETVIEDVEPKRKEHKQSVESRDMPSSSKHTSRHDARRSSHRTEPIPTSVNAHSTSLETEAAIAALNEIHDRENLRIRTQMSKLESDLEKLLQEKKDADREQRRMREERQKVEDEKRRIEGEREKDRRAVKELEREKEELKRRESERVRKVQEEKRKVEEEKERDMKELRREREKSEREKSEIEARARQELERERDRSRKAEEERERHRERERRREKEREHEREKEREKETSAAIAAAAAAAVSAAVGATTTHASSPDGPPFKSQEFQRLPYLPMPPPPINAMPSAIVMPSAPVASSSGSNPPQRNGYAVPRASSSGSQRGYHGHNRRDSYSSLASTTQYDMLQPPNERDRAPLRPIPEDVSVRAPSPSFVSGASMPMPSVPGWATDQTPSGGNTEGWRAKTPGWGTTGLPTSRGPEPSANGSAAPHWPEPSVPNIVGGPQSSSGGAAPHWPEATVPHIVGGPPSRSGGGAPEWPTASVPNIVGGPQSSAGGAAPHFPEATVPNIVGRSPSRAGGSAPHFPEATIPNIVGRSQSNTGGAAPHFPEATVPNIVGRPPSRTGGAAIHFPDAAIPNIVGRSPSRAGGGAPQWPEPAVPNIVAGSQSSTGGATPHFPEATVPNIVGRPPSRTGGVAPHFPEATVPNIVGRPPSRTGGAVLHFPEATVPNIVGQPPSRTGGATSGPNVTKRGGPTANRRRGRGAEPEWPEPTVPDIIRGPEQANAAAGRNARGMGASHSSPYSNPNFLAPSDPNPLTRRPSNGSTGSYEIIIEAPSRSPSIRNQGEDDGTGYWLSPNHSTVPLPSPLPPTGHGTRRRDPHMPYDTSGQPTRPNSPMVLNGPLPAGFVPQTLTDNNGVTTPIWGTGALPGPPGGPVIPPVVSTGSQKYGNPLHKDKDRDDGGGSAPVFPRSPGSSNRPLGAPSPGGWGTAGRVGSLGGGAGMTPTTSTRDLPGAGARTGSGGWGTGGYAGSFGGDAPVFPHSPGSSNRPLGGWGMGTPVGRAGSLGGGGAGMTPATSTHDLPSASARGSIYGNPVHSPAPGSAMQMPEPSVPFIPHPPEDIDDDNGFDHTTTQNTMLNATMGKKAAVPTKKKKKR